MIVVVVVVVLAFSVRSMHRSGSDLDVGRLSMAFLLVCIAFVLTNKVFSTQYMMWLFPFFAMLLYVPELDGKARRLMTMMIVMQILCIVFLRSEIGSALYVIACALRDVLLVAIAYDVATVMRGVTARTSPV